MVNSFIILPAQVASVVEDDPKSSLACMAYASPTLSQLAFPNFLPVGELNSQPDGQRHSEIHSRFATNMKEINQYNCLEILLKLICQSG
ncbi:hypothetical protein KY285_008619 [Solanum tuberosum]|nr:hypothetical protein KY285_008619 [Solanum tuberosum]